MTDLETLAEYWTEAPPLADCVRAWMGIKPRGDKSDGMHLPTKTELSEQEYAEMVATMKANAEVYGRRRN